jgi:hypothetical protein
MTPMERLDAAVAMQPVDRVPVCPLVVFFCARQQGILMKDFVASDKLTEDAIEKTFYDFGGWDVLFSGGRNEPLLFSHSVPVRLKMPGADLPPDSIWQFDEQERMTVEEYDYVIENGWDKFFWNKYLPRMIPGKSSGILGMLTTIPHLIKAERVQIKEIKKWAGRGHPTMMPAAISHPFEILSGARSMEQFSLDLFRRPDKVKAAIEAMIPDVVKLGIRKAKATGIPRIMHGAARGSSTFISPKTFEEFYWPGLKRMVETFHEQGITTMLHHDSDWTPMLPFFKELPRGSAILELDGSTDIFKAKEILGGHLCLMGDVPASLFSLGSPEEVEMYVKKLIDVVGEGGGFILSSGCEVPEDTKPDNFRAMLQTAKTYYPH